MHLDGRHAGHLAEQLSARLAFRNVPTFAFHLARKTRRLARGFLSRSQVAAGVRSGRRLFGFHAGSVLVNGVSFS